MGYDVGRGRNLSLFRTKKKNSSRFRAQEAVDSFETGKFLPEYTALQYKNSRLNFYIHVCGNFCLIGQNEKR